MDEIPSYIEWNEIQTNSLTSIAAPNATAFVTVVCLQTEMRRPVTFFCDPPQAPLAPHMVNNPPAATSASCPIMLDDDSDSGDEESDAGQVAVKRKAEVEGHGDSTRRRTSNDPDQSEAPQVHPIPPVPPVLPVPAASAAQKMDDRRKERPQSPLQDSTNITEVADMKAVAASGGMTGSGPQEVVDPPVAMDVVADDANGTLALNAKDDLKAASCVVDLDSDGEDEEGGDENGKDMGEVNKVEEVVSDHKVSLSSEFGASDPNATNDEGGSGGSGECTDNGQGSPKGVHDEEGRSRAGSSGSGSSGAGGSAAGSSSLMDVSGSPSITAITATSHLPLHPHDMVNMVGGGGGSMQSSISLASPGLVPIMPVVPILPEETVDDDDDVEVLEISGALQSRTGAYSG